ncbi:MAG TPA: EamA family transporter [Clostridiales bacterium]|nr:EamA family transporter [Clostridiales bacterium]
MKTNRQETTAIFQMLICATLWSMAGIFIKLIPWNPFVISGFRSLIAALIMGIYMFSAKMPVMLTKKSIFTGVALFLTFTCFVAANKLTTAANAIVLQFTAPVFIMVFSAVFLGRKFSGADVAAVVLTMAGISLFFFDQLGPGHLLGNMLGLAAGVMMACMYIGVGSGQGPERTTGILIAHLLAFASGIPFIVATGPEFSFQPVMYIIILGVFQLGIPYILLSRAAEHCPPLACSLLGALEPLLNPLWVFLFDGETPGTLALVGGVVVITTITLWCVHGDRKVKAEKA